MPSVSVESNIPAGPSGRTRGNRDTTPNDMAVEFAAMVENDARSQQTAEVPGDIARKRPATSPVEPNADAASPAEPAAVAMVFAESAAAVTTLAVSTGIPTDKVADQPVDEPVSTDEASVAAFDQAATQADAVIPVAVFVGLQANVAPSPTSMIDSSASNSAANAPVVPGGTAALALARVAQDADPAAADTPADGRASVLTKADADPSSPPIPAVVAAVSNENAALETAAELTSRIPAEAATVEADLKLQAAMAAPADISEDHGRLITTSPVLPAPGLSKPSASADQTTAKPAVDHKATSPDSGAKTLDVNSSEERHLAKSASTQTADAPGAALQANDRQPVIQATSAGETSLNDQMSVAFAATTAAQANNHVQQLTVASANPTTQIPVANLAVEIAAHAQIGRSRFEIRLDPPELGRIEVRLDVDRQGQVTSHMIVEKAATLDLLRRDAPQLERALQDAGLKTSDSGLQFSLRDQQSQSDRRDSDHNGRHRQRLTITEDDTVPRETAGRSYGRMLGQRGGVDMRV